MARNTFKNFQSALKYMYKGRFGFAAQMPTIVDHDFDNDTALTWSDAADVTSIPVLAVDTDNRVHIDREVYPGARIPLTFALNANGGLATQTFFIADRNMV